MNKQTSDLVRAAYRRGWEDAVSALRDPEEYHAFIVDHPDRDILALLPSERRAAAVYLESRDLERTPKVSV